MLEALLLAARTFFSNAARHCALDEHDSTLVRVVGGAVAAEAAAAAAAS